VGSAAAEEAVAADTGVDGVAVGSGTDDLEGWATVSAPPLDALAAASAVADGAPDSPGPVIHPLTKAPITSNDRADRHRRSGIRTTAP
jgi:hypothetical protein